MKPIEAARILAEAMNEIEAHGYILYPHPRPVAISIRIPKEIPALHPDYTTKVAEILDRGDGEGWTPRTIE